MSTPMGDQGTPLSAREANERAMRAMAAGDFGSARQLLNAAVATTAGEPALWLNLAACCRALGDSKGALAAVESVLKLDPRSYIGLLMKASLFEREKLGDRRQIALLYSAAAALAPPEQQLSTATRQALQHGREFHRAYVEELAAYIDGEIRDVRSRGSSSEARRINTFIDLTLDRKRNFRQEPMEFFYPGMPAIEFWDRDAFPWLPELERQTGAIRDELAGVLRNDFRDFVPYVNYRDNVPLDQWLQLNRSRRWGALHLYHYGARVEENCSRCPRTMQAISILPQPHVALRMPAAMFSALQPKTRIPPHTGVANVRLVMHLPLIVPDGCGFRVGNETRPWVEGQGWVFDDTIEHEAWNESAQPRVILICDVWNPLLSQAERDLIASVMTAMDKFNGFVPKDDV